LQSFKVGFPQGFSLPQIAGGASSGKTQATALTPLINHLMNLIEQDQL